MSQYLVTWAIDIDDDCDPEGAARAALRKIIESETGGAHVFKVEDKATGKRFCVDLGGPEWLDGPVVVELDPA